MLWYISTEKIDNKRTTSVLGTSRNTLNCLFLYALNKTILACKQICFVQNCMTILENYYVVDVERALIE